MVAQCEVDPPPEISAVLGGVSTLNDDVYRFLSLHKEDGPGSFVLPLDQGWVDMRESVNCTPIQGRFDTISETATSKRLRLTFESTDGCPFRQPMNGGDPGCNCSVADPEGYIYVGVKLQIVDDGVNNAESRKFDLEGATQLRSIRSHIYVDGQEILLNTIDPSNPLLTLTNIGLSPFFLEDGFATSSGDNIVFYDPQDPTNQDYPGYRLFGTPGDVTVNPLDPADQDYSGTVIHLYNKELYEVDKIEIDLLFDVVSPGDTDANRFVDDSEYTSMFTGMPPADPGPSTGGGMSLFDGLSAQTNLYATGGRSPPPNGKKFDAFMVEGPNISRDDFYKTAPGFLNTLSLEFLDDLRGVIEALEEFNLDYNRRRVLLYEETLELLGFQTILTSDEAVYLQVEFDDGAPSLKMRYDDGAVALEVWLDDIEEPVYLYEVGPDDLISIEEWFGPRLQFWTKSVNQIQKWAGKTLAIYDLASNRGCEFLEAWSDVYNPSNGVLDCQGVPCNTFFDILADAAAIFSTAFERWEGLIGLTAPYNCLIICDTLHNSGLISTRRLQCASDFLLQARNDLINLQSCEWQQD